MDWALVGVLVHETDCSEVTMNVFQQSHGSTLPASAASFSSGIERALRVLGALSVLTVGAVHLQQYLSLYSSIPTIGTLFVLNFVGATVIGLGLLAPVERLHDRPAGVLPALLAVGGIGLAATSFVFLFISERTPLFGFMEPGYDPAAILASRVAEAVAVVSLAGYLVARFATARR
jgi:hypothetical protein